MVGKHNHKFCTAVNRPLADFGIVPKADPRGRVNLTFYFHRTNKKLTLESESHFC